GRLHEENLLAAHRVEKLHGNVAVRVPVHHTGAELSAQATRELRSQCWIGRTGKNREPTIHGASRRTACELRNDRSATCFEPCKSAFKDSVCHFVCEHLDMYQLPDRPIRHSDPTVGSHFSFTLQAIRSLLMRSPFLSATIGR